MADKNIKVKITFDKLQLFIVAQLTTEKIK